MDKVYRERANERRERKKTNKYRIAAQIHTPTHLIMTIMWHNRFTICPEKIVMGGWMVNTTADSIPKRYKKTLNPRTDPNQMENQKKKLKESVSVWELRDGRKKENYKMSRRLKILLMFELQLLFIHFLAPSIFYNVISIILSPSSAVRPQTATPRHHHLL